MMCRLLGFAAASPASAAALVGDAQLARFTELARLHGDGWGSAWLAGDGTLAGSTSTLSAVADPAFTQMTHAADTAARIVHLRWATVGYQVEPVNTHPFIADEMAFAHNGCIAPTEALDALLEPATRGWLRGNTDSERYFALIRQELEKSPDDPGAATARAVGSLRLHYPLVSLNALLLTRTQLIVVHANSAQAAPVKEMLALAEKAPLDHVEAYFLMRWLRTEDGSLIFASSGMDSEGWTTLAEESVTVVELSTQQMRTVPLPEYRTVG